MIGHLRSENRRIKNPATESFLLRNGADAVVDDVDFVERVDVVADVVDFGERVDVVVAVDVDSDEDLW